MESEYENFSQWYEALILSADAAGIMVSYKMMFLEFYDRGMTPEETTTYITENGIMTE